VQFSAVDESEVVKELRQENEDGASPRQAIDWELLSLSVIKRDFKRRLQQIQSFNPEPVIISQGTQDT
jgi:hypothetical protein